VIHDFDEIIERPIPFMLHKKLRHIKPITFETLLIIGVSVQQVEKGLVQGDVFDVYYSIFSQAIDDITIKDIKSMTPAQLCAVYALIMRRINGESADSIAGIEDSEKKKT
jgi:hypothetical protein